MRSRSCSAQRSHRARSSAASTGRAAEGAETPGLLFGQEREVLVQVLAVQQVA